MSDKRKVEIFSAGCTVCEDAIELVQNLGCSSCEVEILDMHNDVIAKKAAVLGVKSLPAIAVNGVLADCCNTRGDDKEKLRAAGVGRPL